MTDQKTINIMSGLPGLGKSTLANTIIKQLYPNSVVLSTDDILEDFSFKYNIPYRVAFAKFHKEATKKLKILTRQAINKQADIILDQTNLTSKKRIKLCSRFKSEKYYIICRAIEPPSDTSCFEEWRHRVENRDKQIPKAIIREMILNSNYSSPRLDEGFDEIYFYNLNGDLTRHEAVHSR